MRGALETRSVIEAACSVALFHQCNPQFKRQTRELGDAATTHCTCASHCAQGTCRAARLAGSRNPCFSSLKGSGAQQPVLQQTPHSIHDGQRNMSTAKLPKFLSSGWTVVCTWAGPSLLTMGTSFRTCLRVIGVTDFGLSIQFAVRLLLFEAAIKSYCWFSAVQGWSRRAMPSLDWR